MKNIGKSESETVEFKECLGKKAPQLPEDLWQTIAAFSNTHGGEIYLGVNNDGDIMAISNYYLDIFQKDISTAINGFFNNKPKVKMEVGDGFLKLIVSETEFYNKPIYSQKVGPKQIWIRQGSTNVRATDEEMRSLFAGATGGGENQLVAGKTKDLVDERKVEDYIRKTGLHRLPMVGLRRKLEKLKAMHDSQLTIFGLIAFGKDEVIDEQLNNIYIDFRIFPGTKKVDSDSLDKIYSERKEFHGDIKTQFKNAFKYIKSKLPEESAIDKKTGLRENRFILPEEALREALSNCLAHRDYLAQSSCVNVDLFSDRIELSNPGESLVAIEDLERTPSKARNPNLMEYLKTYRVTDKTARGIPTIYQAARERGLLDPKFENISGSFKATLFFSSPHSGRDNDWVNRASFGSKLKGTQKNALVYVKNNGAISNRQYCEINHMDKRNDDRRARRELAELVRLGLIKAVGSGPGTKYILENKLLGN